MPRQAAAPCCVVRDRPLGQVERVEVEAELVDVPRSPPGDVHPAGADAAVEEVVDRIGGVRAMRQSAATHAEPAEREVVAGDPPVAFVGPGDGVRIDVSARRRLEAGEVQRPDHELFSGLHLDEVEAVEEGQIPPGGGRALPRDPQRPAAVSVEAMARLDVRNRDGELACSRAPAARRQLHADADLPRHVRAHLVGEAGTVAGLRVPAVHAGPLPVAQRIVKRVDGCVRGTADLEERLAPLVVARGRLAGRRAGLGAVVHPAGQVRAPVEVGADDPGIGRNAERRRARVEMPVGIDVGVDHVPVVVVGIEAGLARPRLRPAARADVLRTRQQRVPAVTNPPRTFMEKLGSGDGTRAFSGWCLGEFGQCRGKVFAQVAPEASPETPATRTSHSTVVAAAATGTRPTHRNRRSDTYRYYSRTEDRRPAAPRGGRRL